MDNLTSLPVLGISCRAASGRPPVGTQHNVQNLLCGESCQHDGLQHSYGSFCMKNILSVIFAVEQNKACIRVCCFTVR